MPIEKMSLEDFFNLSVEDQIKRGREIIDDHLLRESTQKPWPPSQIPAIKEKTRARIIFEKLHPGKLPEEAVAEFDEIFTEQATGELLEAVSQKFDL